MPAEPRDHTAAVERRQDPDTIRDFSRAIQGRYRRAEIAGRRTFIAPHGPGLLFARPLRAGLACMLQARMDVFDTGPVEQATVTAHGTTAAPARPLGIVT